MTIHTSNPFADPQPDEVRRFRGRLGGAVTLWTAGSADGRAGLTVTSLMLAHGEEPRVLALLDPDSDLMPVLRETGRCVVSLLSWGDRDLAEAFAGTAPAPGGVFRQAEFQDTVFGPRLVAATTYAELSLVSESDVGWSVLVGCRVERAVVGAEDGPMLGHRRGRFFKLGSSS